MDEFLLLKEMRINKLELINFRNYKNFSFYPNKSLNIITGENGVGKTNLVEAIYYLNLCRGFKNKKDSDLINEDANEFIITANVYSDGNKHNIVAYYNKNKKEKKVMIDDKVVTKFSDLNKCLNVLLFTPSFAEIFKSSPQDRRDYFDLCISKVSEVYLKSLKNYNKLLKERNLALKQENVNRLLIKSLAKQMINEAKVLVLMRSSYITKLNSVISSINNEISNKNKKLDILYAPAVNLGSEFEKTLLKRYEETEEKDILLQTTSVGIHKDDYLMKIDGKDMSIFGSQAENRLASISLVISSYLALRKDVDKPIIILDDVLSELDEENRTKIINLCKNLSQVFITSTETQYKEFEFNLKENN